MPAHKLVDAPKAPQPPGPFSHATVVGPWVYVSGMGGLDPRTGEVTSDDVIEQTRQTIVNLEAILAAAGCTLQHVVKATLYLTDMADYPRVNKVYDEAFAPNKPARTCVAVSALPVRERMKIDLVAYREGNCAPHRSCGARVRPSWPDLDAARIVTARPEETCLQCLTLRGP